MNNEEMREPIVTENELQKISYMDFCRVADRGEETRLVQAAIVGAAVASTGALARLGQLYYQYFT